MFFSNKKNSRIFLALFISCVALISVEWYQSQVIVMESWAYYKNQDDTLYILQNNTSSASSDISTNTPSIDDTLDDIYSSSLVPSTETSLKKSEIIAKNLAIKMFSATIYGYDFTYSPSNKNKEAEEKWTLQPVTTLSINDPNLLEIERNAFNDTLHIFYRYNLLEEQVSLLQAWKEDSKVLHSKGRGISLKKANQDSRIDALYDAVQSAIRNRIKNTLPDSIRMVEGRVRLVSQPFFTDHGSYYRARTSVMLYITNTDLYKIF